MPVTSSPLNSFLTNAQSWDCPFSSHPFDEALIIFQETIHMFFHLIKLFWLSKPALCPHVNHYKHHTMTGYLRICLLFIQNCELMPETMAFHPCFPGISLCVSIPLRKCKHRAQGVLEPSRYTNPGRWEGSQKGNEPTECWRMRTEPGQQGNDLPRRGTSGCKAQGVRVSLAFRGKPGDHRQLPARLDQPLPPDPSPTASLWSALRWGRRPLPGEPADKHPSGKMPAESETWNICEEFPSPWTHTHPHPTIARSGKQRSPRGLHETQHQLCARTCPPWLLHPQGAQERSN